MNLDDPHATRQLRLAPNDDDHLSSLTSVVKSAFRENAAYQGKKKSIQFGIEVLQ